MKGLLKFNTCGSVDDGKSTLIGHLLYDAKSLYTDVEQALELQSKVGSTNGEIDYSLLLDGLLAEREQGITIDVAYRYFNTENRSFIVADTPGHEEYTRNMAVGASFADLAVILVDASKGVLPQTRRHTRICALMGIRHFLFAINKMDLVDYDKDTFEDIKKEIHIMLAAFDVSYERIIPVSATVGDNITQHSQNMDWYQGETVLSALESVDVDTDGHETGFSMPVQRVCRPDHTFRGFQGLIETGEIHLGDAITVLPSKEKAVVDQILVAGKEDNHASKGMAVTLCLDKEIDVSRGCVLVKEATPRVGSFFEAEILWMDDNRLLPGKNFLMKVGTQKVSATIMNIKHKIDVNTGEEISAESLNKNELALCEISTSTKIIYDMFENNPSLGGLILIDRVTHTTSACGVVRRSLKRSDNIFPYEMSINRELRENKNGMKAKTIWLTGLSGSGKSTLANEIEKQFFMLGMHTMTLDGDNLRSGLNKDLGFKTSDRIENIRRAAEVSKLMNDAGLIVISSFVTPSHDFRENAKQIIGEENFIEVYVSTPLEECEKRDTKGLYQKARRGDIAHFPGVNSHFDIPEHPDVTINTANRSLDECTHMVMERLLEILNEKM